MIGLLQYKAGMVARALVSGLRVSIGPIAVLGFVVSVIVPSLQGQTLGASAHVGEEVLKTVQPALTYRDAPSAVVLEGRVSRFVATTPHKAPAIVFGGFRSSGNPGAINESIEAFTAPTPARDGLAGAQFGLSATTTNDVGTVSSLSTSDLVFKGYGLWIDQELMAILSASSDSSGVRCQVKRGQGGSSSQPHASTAMVTIGSLDKFYKNDPKGRPLDAPLVSPWINTVNGKVWQPQGDSDGVSVRWWQEVTNTYGIGALGVRTAIPTPGFGT